MNILFVNESLGYIGGVEQNVADAATLRQRGHACFLAHGGRLGRDAEAYATGFDATWPCREAGAPAGEAFAALVRRAEADVVYFHKVPTLRSFLPGLAGRRAVRMVHDHDLSCPRSHKYFALTGRVCHLAAGWHCMLDAAFLARDRSSPLGVRLVDVGARLRELGDHRALDGLIVASRYMRDQLTLNAFPAGGVHVLPPAVRAVNAPHSEGVPATREILYAGQLIRSKGVDLLLRACARLRGPFSLAVVGDGNARGSLEALRDRLALRDRVRFVGWVAPDGLDPWYQQARLVVMPSRWPEPYGMVGLEAMAHGRPVVAFNVGGIPDWLVDGETGLLVPEQDVGALAAAIQKLLDDGALAERLGRTAAARVRQNNAFEGYLDALEAILAMQGDPAR